MNIYRWFSKLVLFLAGPLLIASCTSTPSVEINSLAEDEPLIGTWINQEPGRGSKAVFTPDGKVFYYFNATDEEPDMEARYTIQELWTDDEGYHYYKVLEKWTDFPYNELKAVNWYKLYMIHPSGDVFEGNWSRSKYPEEISPGMDYYHVDHRE